MPTIKNPTPNMPVSELKKVYINRKSNHLEKCAWKDFIKRYKH